MYAVVGCNSCGNLWLLADPDDQDSATCSRCGKRHQMRKLKRLYTAEDRAAAQEARAALLARKHDDSEEFAAVEHVADLEVQVESSGIDDREYLEAAGLDADEIERVGKSAGAGIGGTSARSHEEIVREAVVEAEPPTEREIVAYAAEHGVPTETANRLLDRLVQSGDASVSGDRYRLL